MVKKKYILGKKGDEGMAINKLVVIVLVILVILGILIFLFRVNILDWIRTLPGYTYPTEDILVTYDKMDEAARKQACPTGIIGDIREITKFGWRTYYYIFINNVNTNLYLDKPIFSRGDPIYVTYDIPIGKLSGDKNVADIANKDIKVRIGMENTLPELKNYLNLINNAYIIPGNVICKKAQTNTNAQNQNVQGV